MSGKAGIGFDLDEADRLAAFAAASQPGEIDRRLQRRGVNANDPMLLRRHGHVVSRRAEFE
jgi:hypothetical protein